MAISYIGGASGGGTDTAISVTHGLTILEDDVIIASIGSDSPGTTTCLDNNGANSFNEEYDSTPSINTMAAHIYSRVAGASEPSAYAFTLSVSEGFSIMIQQFRGVDTAAIWDIDPTSAAWSSDTSDATPAVIADISTIVDGAEAIAFCMADSGSVAFTSIDNSFANELEPSGGLRCAAWRRNVATAGLIGATSIALSVGKKTDAIIFALNPAAGGGATIEVPLGPLR